jgi:hypothetical protein
VSIREIFRQGPFRLILVMVCYLGATVAIAKLGLVGMALNAVFGGLVGSKCRKLLRWINKWEQARQRDELVRFLNWQNYLDAQMTLHRELHREILPYRPNETETLN